MTPGIEFAWQERAIWSRVADRLKARLQMWRRAALTLTVGGALLSTTAAVVGLSSATGKLLAFLSALSIGLAAIAQSRAGTKAVRDWTRARSVAEAITSDVYATLAGFGPSDLDRSVRRINDDARELREHRSGPPPTVPPLPAVHDLSSYLESRVQGQVDDYYLRRAGQLSRTLKAFRILEFALAGAGVVLGAVAGTWEIDDLAVWVPVTTTVAAAVAAHVAAERYTYLLVEYSRTADELQRICDRRGRAAVMTDRQLVRHAERVISIQNDGWLAKLTGADER